MNWRCYFRHRWGEWSEPKRVHVYCRLLGTTDVEIVSEAKPGPLDFDLGECTLRSRWCQRCDAEEQIRVSA